MNLSVVIVSYKCKDKLRITLEALYASQVNFEYEVLLIDNVSNDGTHEMVEREFLSNPEWQRKTTFIVNDENVGFGRANNQGIDISKGEYVLLLNPDTKVAPETLQVMMDFMKTRPDVGISTCKLVKENGELDWASRRSFPSPSVAFYRLSGLSLLFPKHKKFGAYNIRYKSIDEETEVDACVGAFMFMSRACVNTVKGFDPDYHMYGEDLDLCFRAKEAGFKIWYYPKTTTIHYKGQSSRRSPRASLHAFHDAMWIFYKKHVAKKYHPLFNGLVWVGIWARYWVKVLQNALRKEKYVSK